MRSPWGALPAASIAGAATVARLRHDTPEVMAWISSGDRLDAAIQPCAVRSVRRQYRD